MSRVKFALGLVLIAGAAILIAIAMRSRQPSDSDRKVMEQERPGESAAVRGNKSPVKPSESDKVLKNFIKLPGESDRAESNAPRMQSKQIKMH
jgi:hypothetical protein